VRVIVPVAAGGANDTTARLFAQQLAEILRQQFYVENLAGAGGNLGIGTAARAAPDGYTLLAAGGNFVINPSLYAKIPYDPERDFEAVSLMCSCSRCILRSRQTILPSSLRWRRRARANGVTRRPGGVRRRISPANFSSSHSVLTSPMCRSQAGGRP
jgi:hypothetical protein